MKITTRTITARWGRLLGLSVMAAGLPALALADEAVEADSYRIGQTYQSERANGLQACAAACAEDQRCVAWSMTPPTFRVGPRCELKSSVGQRQPRPGYMSGLSGDMAPPQTTSVATRSAPRRTTVRSRPAGSDVLAGGMTTTSSRATASMPPAPSGAATSHMLPTPQAPVRQTATRRTSQPASTRTQLANTVAARSASTTATVEQRPRPVQTAPARTVTRQVETRPVQRQPARTMPAATPPASIARPENDPSRYVTRRTVTPAPQPTTEAQTTVRAATPTVTQTSASPSAAARPTGSSATRTTPAASTSVDTRPPLPRPSRLPSLPSPLERNGTAYSVQNMGGFPGDFDATAGFIDGLPENARVEPIQRDESEERSSSDDDDDDDDSWPEGYPEYPDPLGGPIGRMDDDDED
ncbi:PAN domain-containing protein [Henriciella marina]|uniref:PAN domain-containing protein n=1 Tax=Henriciella marina TaxID=453851 RepID=UPI00036C5539|nr:PAN domain-containing protein [Henriciella marina]